MGRLQIRRLLIVAAIIALFITYSIYNINGSVTWRQAMSPVLTQDSNSKASVAGQDVETPTVPATASSTEAPPELPNHNGSSSASPSAECVSFEGLQRQKPGPPSAGKRKFPYVRPPPECRTFRLPSMEKLITSMKAVIKDPDLYRLFENTYPNTLDTTIKWRGYHNNTDEELAFIITGDIDAMWLRDSASQIYSYLPLLEPSKDPESLASLWRGLINSHARYIMISPYCHSFQPPPESNIPPTHNGAYSQNHPVPPYNPVKVFDCKWELDSLASFLQVSTAYYERTQDLDFFQKYNWIGAVKAAVDAAGAMRLGTYAPDGKVEASAFTFTGWTDRGSETLTNNGIGNPTKGNGMVRSAFRPSDDATIFQLLVPANMMWAKYLEEASLIMEKLKGKDAKNLTHVMRHFAVDIRKAIDKDAVIKHQKYGDIWAYEIDGYGSANLMDDANIPSLLSTPMFNYTYSSFPLPNPKTDYATLYQNTRNFILSGDNPYFMKGPVISAVGGPHLGPGKAWPMAAIVRALTALLTTPPSAKAEKDIEDEVLEQIEMIMDSTAGTGVVHESVNSWNEDIWSRSWFGWANGLFGELIMRLSQEDNKYKKNGRGYLGASWQ